MSIRKFIARFAVVLAVLIGLEGFALADKVHLKDGSVLEGTISREVDGYVWLVVEIAGIENKRLITPDQIDRIERTAAPVVNANSLAAEAKDPVTFRSGTPRGVVMTLEGMVGMQMAAHSLRQAIPWLEKNEIDVVVLKINSGGGYLLEIEYLSDVIHEEYKPRFRTVAWIESAISAAAMTAHCCEEIYFMSEGNYGACTGWSGALQAVEGYSLEKVLHMMEKFSARGGYDPLIMRAMQIMVPLSCTIDENGDVHWFEDNNGEIIVNRGDRILTFDHQMAKRVKFSKGTADSLDELAAAMQYDEIEWVGKDEAGGLFPVSEAEEIQRKYRGAVDDMEVRLGEYWTKYQMAVGQAQGAANRQARGAFVGKARRYLQTIVRSIRTNPKFCTLILGFPEEQFEEWIEQQEKMLRDLMR